MNILKEKLMYTAHSSALHERIWNTPENFEQNQRGKYIKSL